MTKADSLPESEQWIREKCNLDNDPQGSDSDESESDSDSSSDSGADVKQKKQKGTNVAKMKIKSAKTEGSLKGLSPNVLTLDDESIGSFSPAKKMKTS